MYSHAKVPRFDMENMPFVIFGGKRYPESNFYIVNIKTCTYQLLVKTDKYSRGSGFCLALEDGSFDFHFTHTFEDENKIEHEAHHRIQMRNDLLQFLKEHQ